MAGVLHCSRAPSAVAYGAIDHRFNESTSHGSIERRCRHKRAHHQRAAVCTPADPARYFCQCQFFRLADRVGLVCSAAWYIYLYAFTKSASPAVMRRCSRSSRQIDGRIHQARPYKAKRQRRASPGRGGQRPVRRLDGRRSRPIARCARRSLPPFARASTISPAWGGACRRGREYQTALVDRLEHEVKEDEAALASARLSEAKANDALKRGAVLIPQGTISRVAYDGLSYAYERGTPRWRGRQRAWQIRWDLAAAREGVSSATAFIDCPFATASG